MEEPSIFLVLFGGSFEDPGYCSLTFLRISREREIPGGFGSWKGDNKVKNGVFIMNVLTVQWVSSTYTFLCCLLVTIRRLVGLFNWSEVVSFHW